MGHNKKSDKGTNSDHESFAGNNSIPIPPQPTSQESNAHPAPIKTETANEIVLSLEKLESTAGKSVVTPEQYDRIKKMLHKTPQPPSLLNEIICEDPLNTYDAKELANMVKRDPLLAAKILQTVNSSYYGVSKEVTGIHRAVVYLGFNLVKDIALRHSLDNAFKVSDPLIKEAFKRFWLASFVASSLCFRLAQHYSMAGASDLATRSLFSYLGNFIIIAENPGMVDFSTHSLFQRTSMEHQRLGVNATQVSAILAKKWGLPDTLVNGLRQNLLPMFKWTGISELEDPQELANLREIVLCYACCRVGDIIAFQDVRDAAKISLSASSDPELNYLSSYLKLTGMEKFDELLQSAQIYGELNKLILEMATRNNL